MGLANIPDDWSGEYIDYVVKWPHSDQWDAILRGQLTAPKFQDFWDLFSGDPEMSQDAMDETLDTNLHLQEGAMLPAGLVMEWAGPVIPEGWLQCDFSEVSRETYAALFAAIGTTWGAGDGSSTFNLPFASGRVTVALDITDVDFNTLGDFGGQKTVTLETTEMPSHTHVQDAHNHVQNAHSHTQNAHNHTQNAHNHTQNPHQHDVFGQLVAAAGVAQRQLNISSSSSNVSTSTDVATNIAATPTNIATAATNIASTPTNIATVGTNQNEGGGNPHNNLQPYIVMYKIIKF